MKLNSWGGERLCTSQSDPFQFIDCCQQERLPFLKEMFKQSKGTSCWWGEKDKEAMVSRWFPWRRNVFPCKVKCTVVIKEEGKTREESNHYYHLVVDKSTETSWNCGRVASWGCQGLNSRRRTVLIEGLSCGSWRGFWIQLINLLIWIYLFK